MEKQINSTNFVFENTLENPDLKLTRIRRDGNSTRVVDNAIQILFSGKVCVVMDHYAMGDDTKANHFLLKRILKRLEIEHRWVFESKGVIVDHNKKYPEISFKKADWQSLDEEAFKQNKKYREQMELTYAEHAEMIKKNVRDIRQYPLTIDECFKNEDNGKDDYPKS